MSISSSSGGRRGRKSKEERKASRRHIQKRKRFLLRIHFGGEWNADKITIPGPPGLSDGFKAGIGAVKNTRKLERQKYQGERTSISNSNHEEKKSLQNRVGD